MNLKNFSFVLLFSLGLLIVKGDDSEQHIINITISDAITAISNDIAGALEGAGLLIPSTQDILQLPLSIVAGLPSKVVFSLFNDLCKLILASDNIQPPASPNISRLNLVLENNCTKISVPLLEAERLWDVPQFDRTKPVIIAVSGWTTEVNSSKFIYEASKAFNCRQGYNFIALDAAYYIDVVYTWAALNTKQIGFDLAVAISKLAGIIPIETVHLIGHSLGAQIVGYAGQYVTELTGISLNHITGLDPAKPCFNEGHELSPIQRGNAKYVDIVHSSPGVIGKAQALGDLDYYPNGYRTFQPGCFDFVCTHYRSVLYYVDTIYPNNVNDYQATQCTTLFELENGFCNGPKYRMGFEVPTNIKGRYFSTVNAKEPFGNNAAPNHQYFSGPCGRCPDNIEIQEV